MEGWYSIYEIKFSKKQMWFLIRHLEELELGIYPPQPPVKEPQYGDTSPPMGYNIELPRDIKARRYREPASNRVLDLAAEVEIRLGLIIDYISGSHRPRKKIRRNTDNIY